MLLGFNFSFQKIGTLQALHPSSAVSFALRGMQENVKLSHFYLFIYLRSARVCSLGLQDQKDVKRHIQGLK